MERIQFLEEKCREIVQSRMGITSPISNVEVKIPNLQGEHMATVCYQGKVEFQDKLHEPVQFFIKSKLKSGKTKDMIDAMRAFETEGNFLTGFINEMKSFCEQQGSTDDVKKSFTNRIDEIFPKAHYADEETVILQNIVPLGFACLDKMKGHTLEQATLVIRNLAFFNGITYVMIKAIGKEEFLQKHPYLHDFMFSQDNKDIADFYRNTSNTVLKVLKESKVPKSNETADKLIKGNWSDPYILAKKLIQREKYCCFVVSHNDCWNNNMMFKMDRATNSPLAMKLIDLQTVSLGCPSFDLSYYLYTAVDSGVRKTNIHSLLQLYYDEVQKTVQALSSSCDFTFEDLMKDYHHNAQYGLTVGLMCIIGLSAINEVNTETSEDGMTDFENAVQKFVNSHPQMADKLATQIIDLVGEFLDIAVLDTV